MYRCGRAAPPSFWKTASSADTVLRQLQPLRCCDSSFDMQRDGWVAGVIVMDLNQVFMLPVHNKSAMGMSRLIGDIAIFLP